MTVSAANRIQSNSALVTAASSFTVSLPNPTTAGSTLLLFVGTASAGSISIPAQSFDPPFVQDQGHGSQWYAWRRDDQPAGESSWTIASVVTSSTYYWSVQEWAGLSTLSQPDATQNIVTLASPGATFTTDQAGLVGSPATADVSDFVALAVFRLSFAGASGWPAAHAYGAGASSGPSSWNEVAYLVSGTGTGSNDFILAIAEAYPGATGAVACGLTMDTSGGGALPASEDAWAVCYRPSMPPPALGVLTS